jgi:hypothetical protein
MPPEPQTQEPSIPQTSSTTIPSAEPVAQQPSADIETKSTEPLVESGEILVAVVHRHPIGLVAIYVGAAAALAAVLILFIFAPSSKAFNNLSGSASGAIIGALWLTVILLSIVLAVIVRVYKQSKLIVTDKSLVQVIQRSLFNRKISRLSMSNVEDVNAEKCGILPTMFNYGTLTIQTAGEEDNFIFPWCPDPDIHADSILKARQQYVQKYGDVEHSHG